MILVDFAIIGFGNIKDSDVSINMDALVLSSVFICFWLIFCSTTVGANVREDEEESVVNGTGSPVMAFVLIERFPTGGPVFCTVSRTGTGASHAEETTAGVKVGGDLVGEETGEPEGDFCSCIILTEGYV